MLEAEARSFKDPEGQVYHLYDRAVCFLSLGAAERRARVEVKSLISESTGEELMVPTAAVRAATLENVPDGFGDIALVFKIDSVHTTDEGRRKLCLVTALLD